MSFFTLSLINRTSVYFCTPVERTSLHEQGNSFHTFLVLLGSFLFSLFYLSKGTDNRPCRRDLSKRSDNLSGLFILITRCISCIFQVQTL